MAVLVVVRHASRRCQFQRRPIGLWPLHVGHVHSLALELYAGQLVFGLSGLAAGLYRLGRLEYCRSGAVQKVLGSAAAPVRSLSRPLNVVVRMRRPLWICLYSAYFDQDSPGVGHCGSALCPQWLLVSPHAHWDLDQRDVSTFQPYIGGAKTVTTTQINNPCLEQPAHHDK